LGWEIFGEVEDRELCAVRSIGEGIFRSELLGCCAMLVPRLRVEVRIFAVSEAWLYSPVDMIPLGLARGVCNGVSKLSTETGEVVAELDSRSEPQPL
jgi:hypothetical protein